MEDEKVSGPYLSNIFHPTILTSKHLLEFIQLKWGPRSWRLRAHTGRGASQWVCFKLGNNLYPNLNNHFANYRFFFYRTLQEAQAVKLVHSLQGWGEIILPTRSVLLWEKNWHPAAIAGGKRSAFSPPGANVCVTGSTVFFLVLYLLDPSVLTAFSVLGLTLVVSDYIVPALTTRLVDSAEFWTPANEKAFSELCRAIIIYKERAAVSCAAFRVKRTTNPKLVWIFYTFLETCNFLFKIWHAFLLFSSTIPWQLVRLYGWPGLGTTWITYSSPMCWSPRCCLCLALSTRVFSAALAIRFRIDSGLLRRSSSLSRSLCRPLSLIASDEL